MKYAIFVFDSHNDLYTCYKKPTPNLWDLYSIVCDSKYNNVLLKKCIFESKEMKNHRIDFNHCRLFKAKTSKGLRKKIDEYLLLKEII